LFYVVIDQKTADGKDLVDIAFKAAAGGADIIQLRSDGKNPDNAALKTAIHIKKAVAKYGSLFIVNDRPDIALASGADGVHLGQDDMPLEQARRILGAGRIIGVSTHSIRQAIEAQRSGADYISVGPIFRTPTKPEYRPVGLNLLKKVDVALKAPFFAIGGIDYENIGRVISAGAKRVAVVRAVVAASDAEQATKRLKTKLTRYDTDRNRKTE
jgi:thiamine-phosphate pyrophosphorylase